MRKHQDFTPHEAPLAAEETAMFRVGFLSSLTGATSATGFVIGESLAFLQRGLNSAQQADLIAYNEWLNTHVVMGGGAVLELGLCLIGVVRIREKKELASEHNQNVT